MPTLPKELITPELYGAMIYSGVLPVPDGAAAQVERAFERLAISDGLKPQKFIGPETKTRTSATITDGILACLSTSPLTMRTARQIWSAIKSGFPRLTVERVQARLKIGAGKPGMWIAGPGGKYGMPGAAATKQVSTRKGTIANQANVHVIPAPPALPGEKSEDRVLKYIQAHAGCTKDTLIAAFAASETPRRANHIGIDLGRLTGRRKGAAQRIMVSPDGSYYAPMAVPTGLEASAGAPT